MPTTPRSIEKLGSMARECHGTSKSVVWHPRVHRFRNDALPKHQGYIEKFSGTPYGASKILEMCPGHPKVHRKSCGLPQRCIENLEGSPHGTSKILEVSPGHPKVHRKSGGLPQRYIENLVGHPTIHRKSWKSVRGTPECIEILVVHFPR